jgi:hypothetical protein
MAGAGGDADAGRGPRWDVALSFAGAQRDCVEQVALALQEQGVRCFYDADEQIDLWGKYLAEELPAIYGEQTAAVVVFVSAEYAARDWTRYERRVALARAVRERREYVLPARFDDTPLPGLLSDMVTVNLRAKTPQQFAAMIGAKLAALGITGPPPDEPPAPAARPPSQMAPAPFRRLEARPTELIRLSHDGWVLTVAFSPDGTWLATGSSDGIARIWDTASGHQLARLPHGGGWLARLFHRGDVGGGIQPGLDLAGHRQPRRHGPDLGPLARERQVPVCASVLFASDLSDEAAAQLIEIFEVNPRSYGQPQSSGRLSGAPGRAEQAGDLGDCRVPGFDVAHGGAGGLVPGLGHNQLQRDLLIADVSRRGVPCLRAGRVQW